MASAVATSCAPAPFATVSSPVAVSGPASLCSPASEAPSYAGPQPSTHAHCRRGVTALVFCRGCNATCASWVMRFAHTHHGVHTAWFLIRYHYAEVTCVYVGTGVRFRPPQALDLSRSSDPAHAVRCGRSGRRRHWAQAQARVSLLLQPPCPPYCSITVSCQGAIIGHLM